MPDKDVVIDVDIINIRETIPHIAIYNIVTETILYGYYLLYIDKLDEKVYIHESNRESNRVNFLETVRLKYINQSFYLNYTLKNIESNKKEINKTIVIHASKEIIEELASLFRLDISVYKKTLETFKINLKINHKKFLLGWKTKFLTDITGEINVNFDMIKNILKGLEENNLYKSKVEL